MTKYICIQLLINVHGLSQGTKSFDLIDSTWRHRILTRFHPFRTHVKVFPKIKRRLEEQIKTHHTIYPLQMKKKYQFYC